MSAQSMADVLAWHKLDTAVYLVTGEEYLCICGKRSENHEVHQAAALSAAGFGMVTDAKAEALREAAREMREERFMWCLDDAGRYWIGRTLNELEERADDAYRAEAVRGE